MKAETLRELTKEELASKILELKEELFNLRFQMATGQLQNTVQLKRVRKDIARCKTMLTEKERA